MKDSTRELLMRRRIPVAILGGVVIMLIGAIAFPQRYMQYVAGVAVMAIGTFTLWAITAKSKPSATQGVPTIRANMARSRLIYTRVVTFALLAWVAFVTLFWFEHDRSRGLLVSAGGGAVIAALGWLFFRSRFLCPQCGTNFRAERVEKLGKGSMDKRGAEVLWDSCPKCGVSFDSPYPH
ncbi:MAG: hypothetical protein JSS29_10980 [Proteobacteria bacterium]|nr:hypothetical protein [Pseudomonadota bacterium]